MKLPYTTAQKWLLLSPLFILLLIVGQSVSRQPKSLVIDMPDAAGVQALSYSPDGKRLAVLAAVFKSNDIIGRIFDVTTGKKVCDLTAPPVSKEINAHFILGDHEWSPDGTRIVVRYHKNTTGNVKIRNLYQLGKPMKVASEYLPYDSKEIIKDPPAKNDNPDYDEYGSPLFHYNRITKFAFWDTNTGALQGPYLYAPINEESGLGGMRFSPDGKRLIGASSPPAIFDAATGKRLSVLRGTIPTASGGLINDELGLLAVQDYIGGRFQVFDTKAKRVVWEPKPGGIDQFYWKGDVLGMTQWSNLHTHLLLWNAKTRKLLPTPRLKFPDVYDISFSPDKRTLVYFNAKRVDSGHPTPNATGELLAWDFRRHRVLWRYPIKRSMTDIKWSPDGKWLSTTVDYTHFDPPLLLILDRNGKRHLQRSTYFGFAAWSPDSRHLANVFNGVEQTAKIEIFNVGK